MEQVIPCELISLHFSNLRDYMLNWFHSFRSGKLVEIGSELRLLRKLNSLDLFTRFSFRTPGCHRYWLMDGCRIARNQCEYGRNYRFGRRSCKQIAPPCTDTFCSF